MSDTDTNEPQTGTADPAGDESTREAEAGDVTPEDDAATEAEADVVAGDAAEATVTPDETAVIAADESADADAGEAAGVDADADVVAADGQAPADAEAAADDQAPADADTAEPGEAAVATDDVITDEELLERPPAESPYDRPGRWFVVHTQSGYEKKVKQNLEARIVSMNAEDAIYEVVIPMEDYVDFRNGKRIVAQRKMFPGYLLVRAALDDQAWFVIRNTPGVTGFVGQGAKPSPLPRRDVESFLVPKGGTEEQVAQRAKPRLEYEIGETVRVREGPFADFSGEVIELNEDQLKLKVLVNIFGRETPVELEFSKVAKL
ncbi:MAG: transcription termination/antitermination protein NusG [Acidimicrobiales bacterium]